MIDNFNLAMFIESNKTFGNFENLKCLLTDDLHDYIKIRVSQFEEASNKFSNEYTLQIYCLGLLNELDRKIHFSFYFDKDGNVTDEKCLIPSFEWMGYHSKGNFSIEYNCCYTFNDVDANAVPQEKRPVMEEEKGK